MANNNNMLQICRLCLVKDDVNIPIFEDQGDIRQIFLKISSCLPVKVAREDRLPKKICDGCSYKLDMLYEFWNTSANAEKQLLSWLGEAGVPSKMADGALTAVAQQMKPAEAFVKEETLELPDGHADDDDKEYLFAQQKVEESASAGPSATVTSNEDEEPPPKRARRTAAVKAAIAMDQESDDDDDSGEPLTKIEDESEDSDGEDHVPAFVDVPSTSADDQPGPSGVGKDGVEAPSTGLPQKKERTKKGKLNSVRIKRTGTPRKPPGKYTPKTKPNLKARAWVCKVCFDEFESRKALFEHRKLDHDDPGSSREDIDEKKFIFDPVHEFYTCANCSAEFQTLEEVQKHLEGHEEKYECVECAESFSGALNFSAHMQQLHRDDKNFPCPMCHHTTGRKSAMLTHIQRMHYRKYDFQCRICGKCFNDATTFKEHENSHMGLKPFVCVVCGREFVYSRYLFAHQIRNHRVRVLDKESTTQCQMCPKMFARQETLTKHVTKHLTFHEGPHEKKHLCDVCGQGFSRTDKLKIHYRKHTGEKPYACAYCSKSFIKRDYLIMHERIHNGEKPYVCDYCGKSFNQGAPLRIHMRSHTGERPYKCPHCGVGCVSKGALNAHIKSCLNSL